MTGESFTSEMNNLGQGAGAFRISCPSDLARVERQPDEEKVKVS